MTNTTTLEPPASPKGPNGAPAVSPYPGSAACAVAASKIYGSGDTEVRALDAIDVTFEQGPLHRHHGPVRVRESPR